MENFEKCTVAMLGGPCSQHVTGNTSLQNQPQSAMKVDMDWSTNSSHSSGDILQSLQTSCYSMLVYPRNI